MLSQTAIQFTEEISYTEPQQEPNHYMMQHFQRLECHSSPTRNHQNYTNLLVHPVLFVRHRGLKFHIPRSARILRNRIKPAPNAELPWSCTCHIEALNWIRPEHSSIPQERNYIVPHHSSLHVAMQRTVKLP